MDDNDPTQPLPPIGPVVPREATSVAPPKPRGEAPLRKTRKRRRWIIAVIVLLVFVVLAIVAFFVAEDYARAAARDYVRERIVQVLGLPDEQLVKVDLGEGYLLLQALTGRVDEVQVTIDSLSVGELNGSAVIVARGVPLDQSAAVDELDIQFTIPEENLNELSGYLSGADLESVQLEGEAIRIGSTLRFFTIALPVAVGLEPTAQDGQLIFTPVDIVLGENTVTVEDLRGGIFGGLADLLLQSQAFCVASFLPESFEVVDVAVQPDALVISIDGSGAVLGGPSMSTRGTCE